MGIHVERYGSGTPLIFVHGAGGTTKSWLFQQQLLSPLFEIILVDLPGHGRSGGEGFNTIEDYARIVSDVADREGLERFFVVGHSMGGAIAMHLALAGTAQPAGIVLIGTGARLKVFPAILEGVLTDKESMYRQIIEYAYSPRTAAAVKEASYEEYAKNRPEVVYGDFVACDHFDVRDSLHRISVPTLVICGSDDALTPPKYAEYLHQHIAGSSLSVIDGAGHMVMLEKPQEVNRVIETFVSGAL